MFVLAFLIGESFQILSRFMSRERGAPHRRTVKPSMIKGSSPSDRMGVQGNALGYLVSPTSSPTMRPRLSCHPPSARRPPPAPVRSGVERLGAATAVSARLAKERKRKGGICQLWKEKEGEGGSMLGAAAGNEPAKYGSIRCLPKVGEERRS